MSDFLSDLAHKADPYPLYARLRAESPVHRLTRARGRTTWIVSRYDDVVTVLSDPRFINDHRTLRREGLGGDHGWRPWFVRPMLETMLHADAPEHVRLRHIAMHAFSPGKIETARPRVTALTEGLLRRAAARQPLDLVRDYAAQIPLAIIADILGVPESDRVRVQRWIMNIVTANKSWRRAPALGLSAWRCMRYLRDAARMRERGDRDDFMTALTHAYREGQLNEAELLALIYFLILAGQTTTEYGISGGILALLQQPGELERLRRDPSLIKSAVEELFRYCSPTEVAAKRYALETVRLSGTTIHAGDAVYAAIASANRDERHFADPDRLDLTRQPNRHIAFGIARHFCAGAQLARLETQIAIDALLQQTSDLRLAIDARTLRWRPGRLLRGPASLPVWASFKAA